MRFVVRADILVAYMKEVVKPKTDRHFALGRYERKDAAAQYDEAGLWQSKECAIEQNELPQRCIQLDLLFKATEDLSVSGQLK